MNKATLNILGVAAVGAGLILSTARAESLAATADITFSGSSTLHDFEGTATSLPFDARFTEDQETGRLQVNAKAMLNVQRMTTENKKRDINMFKMFDLEHFKLIVGELPETTITAEGDTRVRLHLKIRNVENDVDATISNVQRNGNTISCNMKFPVSLKTFGLKGPSVLGLIRVDDTVYVECIIKGEIGEPGANN